MKFYKLNVTAWTFQKLKSKKKSFFFFKFKEQNLSRG